MSDRKKLNEPADLPRRDKPAGVCRLSSLTWLLQRLQSGETAWVHCNAGASGQEPMQFGRTARPLFVCAISAPPRRECFPPACTKHNIGQDNWLPGI